MARILVVEDERAVATDIQRCLVQRGHDVPVVASSVEEAITAAGLVRPDLALMDVTLNSPLDGIECAVVLRDRFHTPVVFLTAHGDEAMLERARQVGPVGYAIKPIHDQMLAAAVAVALQRIAIDEELRRRESWLSAVLSSIVDGVVTIGPDGLVTLLNPAASDMTGLVESEAVGRKFMDVIRFREGAETHLLSLRIDAMVAKSAGPRGPLRCTLLGPDQLDIPVECTVTPIHGGGSIAAGAVVVMRDVTEGDRAERALIVSEQKYRSLFENAVEGFFVSTPEGSLVAANPALAALFGCDSVDELMSITSLNLTTVYLYPANRDTLLARLQKDGQVRDFEAEYRRPDGTTGWFSANVRAQKDAGGIIRFLEGTLIDITARKHAMETLASREACLRSILDNSPYIIWVKDVEGRYIDLNRILAEKCGFDAIESMRGKNDFDIYPPEEAARLRNQDIEIMKGGNRIVLEETKDEAGRRRYAEKYKSVLKDASGKIIGTVGFSRDITEAKEQENRLRKLSRAVEQSSSTIVITDTRGNIEYVNPRFFQLTGFTLEEVIGSNPRMLKSGATPKEAYEQLWQTILSGGEWRGELQNRKKNGDLFWEYETISPIRDESGITTHFVCIKEDITKRKVVEAELACRAKDLQKAKSEAEKQARRLGLQTFELRKAREEALKASNLKSEFVANMSHEIRTPMNGVLGMTGLLLDTSLDQEQREYAEIIRTSGEVLLSIVNDILDFSKIEAGRLDLEEVEFQLKTTLDESMDFVSTKASEKGLELCCDVGDGVPLEVRGDPGRLRQVLTNLLANAVKFTEHGEVEAGVTCVKQSGNKCMLRFAVRDTGIGISDEERSRLFRPFSQADGSKTRKYGGTGLGLVIAKQLVGLMGGEIGVTSEKGKGSEFWFTVNFEGNPSAPVEPPPAALRGVRVLIVDDNATSRKVLAHQLSSWEMRPEAASSAEEALALLGSESTSGDPFRIALLDVHMPVTDGVQLARRIYADRALDGIRLMLLTSAGPGSVREARAMGLSGCVNKPARETTLRRYLEQILSSPEGRRPVRPLSPQSHSVTASAPSKQVGPARRVLIAEDNPANQLVAVKMLEKAGCKADVVSNGNEAVDAVSKVTYDIVFMDCQMPGMDGFEATGRIRKLNGGAEKTLIIAMTANALSGDRERCIASGMDDYISKPVTQDALDALLLKWETLKSAVYGTGGKKRPGAGSGPGSLPEPRFEEAKIGELRSLAAGADPAWFDTLILKFMEDSADRIELLRTACRTGVAGTVEEVAHALKGSSGTMGMAGMQRIAARLQAVGRSGSLEGAGALLDELERELDLAGGHLTGMPVERAESNRLSQEKRKPTWEL